MAKGSFIDKLIENDSFYSNNGNSELESSITSITNQFIEEDIWKTRTKQAMYFVYILLVLFILIFMYIVLNRMGY